MIDSRYGMARKEEKVYDRKRLSRKCQHVGIEGRRPDYTCKEDRIAL